MVIIQLPQGYYRDLTGTPKTTALATFAEHDAEFVRDHPKCARYHQPCWREFEAKPHERAPWGHEWYEVDERGVLRMHSAQYDSSG